MIPRPLAAAAELIGEVAKASRDTRPHTHCLKYREGTPLGKRFPMWRFGYRRSEESCEATRLMCAHPDQIEIVRAGE